MSSYIINQNFGDSRGSALIEFYRIAFGADKPAMPSALIWLHKVETNRAFVPLAVWYNDSIIGTWSSIPEKLMIGGKLVDAAWTLNLFVLPEHRGKGLAEALLEEQKKFGIPLMGISANQASLSIYLKKGFRQTEMFGATTFLYLKPFSEARFSKFQKLRLNKILDPVYNIYLRAVTSGRGNYSFKALQEAGGMKDGLMKAFELEQSNDNRIRVVRNNDYFVHRVLESPHAANYYVYECNQFYALVHLKEATGSYDVLWVSDTKVTKAYQTLVSDLAGIAARQGLRGVRFFTSNHEVSASLKTRFVISTKTPLSIIYHPDPAYLDMLLSQPWDVQNIDTDLEGFIL